MSGTAPPSLSWSRSSRVAPYQTGKPTLNSARERRDPGLGFGVVERRDDEPDAAGGVLLFHLHEHRHFGVAGAAPCGPEVEHYRLASQIAQTDLLAVGIAQRAAAGCGWNAFGDIESGAKQQIGKVAADQFLAIDEGCGIAARAGAQGR